MLLEGSECNMKHVEKTIASSNSFGWSWMIKESEPFRHSAIELFFGGKPTYTLNFLPQQGTKYVAAASCFVEPQVTIERMKGSVKVYNAILSFPITSQAAKKLAFAVVNLFVSYHPTKYNLFTSNCRDYVKDVVEQMVKHGLCDSKNASYFSNEMKKLKGDDKVRIMGGIALAFFIIGLTVYGIYKFMESCKTSK